ncbi:hypothetical protein AVEN_250273-1 [Araneus ventricosus]|uniref:Uncharacterized protein n=1 Tax=Araneus ventricosus TaxID=182803 RepID=A0A4Y2SKE7_ARAVE|nr:hypothetical protein AVEN_184595-1 [Araneus ventricosus]GBN88086.1 hypothetical protein AVEN_170712-1 [Araneus ventricosus]GBN88100.1 hypothetical protein AVEN_4751-1 [Araneus ventricosus]GBN88119.1 hypothetical protein AVEN_250273-1 [Araneus ventricosus]
MIQNLKKHHEIIPQMWSSETADTRLSVGTPGINTLGTLDNCAKTSLRSTGFYYPQRCTPARATQEVTDADNGRFMEYPPPAGGLPPIIEDCKTWL